MLPRVERLSWNMVWCPMLLRATVALPVKLCVPTRPSIIEGGCIIEGDWVD